MNTLRQKFLVIGIFEALFATSYLGAVVANHRTYPSYESEVYYWIFMLAPVAISAILNAACLLFYALLSRHIFYKICFILFAAISSIIGAFALFVGLFLLLVPVGDASFEESIGMILSYLFLGAMLVTPSVYFALQKISKH